MSCFCVSVQDRSVSWLTTVLRGRAVMAVAARRPATASAAAACRDMWAGRAPMTSTSVSVDRARMAELALTRSAATGKPELLYTKTCV